MLPARGPHFAHWLASQVTDTDRVENALKELVAASHAAGTEGWTTAGDLKEKLLIDDSGCGPGAAVSAVAFRFRLRSGTLSLVDAAGRRAWSRTGDQGDAWRPAIAILESAAFRFAVEGATAAAAVSEVEVTCGVEAPATARYESTGVPRRLQSGHSFADRAALLAARDAWCANSTAAAITYGHISTWDVSVVTDLSWMFCAHPAYVSSGCNTACANFNDDISGWDTSSVTTLFVRRRWARLGLVACLGST